MKKIHLLLMALMCVISFILGANVAATTTTRCTPPAIGRPTTTAPCTLPSLKPANPTAVVVPRPTSPLVLDATSCVEVTRKHFNEYMAYAEGGDALRKQHGPLKIAAFSRLWVPPIHGTGGMQYHALHLYSQLAAQGHTVHVFVTGGPHGPQKLLRFAVDPATLKLTETDEASATLTVHQVASDANGEYSVTWFANVLAAFVELNRTIGGFHVAHSESWAAVPNVYQIGLPLAVTWHGSMLDWFRNELNLIVHNFRMKGEMTKDSTALRMKDLGSSVSYEAFTLLSVPHHIVISDSAADDLISLNLIEANRVHLIYNGVNPSNFKPRPEARVPFLREVGITDNPFVVGCGGRLERIKGHAQLARAMEAVLTAHSDVVLLVAGHGGESEKYEKLKAKGLRVYLLGMLNQQRLASFYQSLDVFVDPFYQHHGLNTVMIEAVLSGVPLIATALASAKTTVPCEAYGRTFGLGLVDELVAQILDLKARPEERKAIGERVRERALKLFTSSTMALRYERLLYDAWLRPSPLLPMTGEVVCKRAYPAMCFRKPH